MEARDLKDSEEIQSKVCSSNDIDSLSLDFYLA